MAKDQSAAAAAAKKALAAQSSRSTDFHDAFEEFLEDGGLSEKARQTKEVMENIFFDLPENLPDWEYLKEMSPADCIAVINAKIEKVRVSVGDGTETESFQKATTPVVYSLPQTDDRLAQLHSASFLRAPLSEPGVYWHLLGKRHAQVFSFWCLIKKVLTLYF